MINKKNESAIGKDLEYLNTSSTQLETEGGKYTAKEISHQPQLWLDTYKLIVSQQSKIKKFLSEISSQNDPQVILTGAGTSAFIGDILHGSFQKITGLSTKAIATTDLVSHPELYLQKKKPTLLISFARSGNSPESLAAINLANAICENIYHLKITCNPEGDMVKKTSQDNTLVFLLPSEADDQSLAMTGSFTSMLLTGLLIAHIDKVDEFENRIERLSEYGRNILVNYNHKIRNIASLDFKRAVFLGSGPLLGSARESHLKLQELTDGKVICKHDSFLGFRHGPKVVIDSDTLIVYLFSNDKYVHQYEADLVKDINTGENGLFTIGILESEMYNDLDLKNNLDLTIPLSDKKNSICDEFLAVCYVLVAQLLGYHKSINLGLKPDSPSKSNTITRVVQGVHIYPYNGQTNKANGKNLFL